MKSFQHPHPYGAAAATLDGGTTVLGRIEVMSDKKYWLGSDYWLKMANNGLLTERDYAGRVIPAGKSSFKHR